MTQAQIDLQKQLEQATADLTIRPPLNISPVLYIDTSEPTPSRSLEQMEHTTIEHDTPKIPTPPDDTDRTQATPPPPKKRYEIMKDPVFLSSPIYSKLSTPIVLCIVHLQNITYFYCLCMIHLQNISLIPIFYRTQVLPAVQKVFKIF